MKITLFSIMLISAPCLAAYTVSDRVTSETVGDETVITCESEFVPVPDGYTFADFELDCDREDREKREAKGLFLVVCIYAVCLMVIL